MYYSIRHVSKFRYSTPIRESMMEVRMQPRNEGLQHLLSFVLQTAPRAAVTAYRDGAGNGVHHFDVPDSHGSLTITATALVSLLPGPAAPERLEPTAWDELDRLVATDEYWDDLAPSRFARPGPLLRDFAAELDLGRRDDPLSTARAINAAIHDAFAYKPQSTRANSPIDDALRLRQGVCQDFAHIMIALLRELGIPSRYVSGYLAHRAGATTAVRDRSAADATHAWVEALLPPIGWVGFDPTNSLVTGERHIRVAVGRDYDDVPPTHGVYKGRADNDLSVAVQVTPSDGPPSADDLPSPLGWAPSGNGQQ